MDAGRDVGLLVHTLLERVDLVGEVPAREGLLRQAMQIAADTGLHLADRSLERVLDLVTAFWESPLAGVPGLASGQREVPFFFLQGDVTVHGVMDLLCREENRWRIVDYKSNSLGSRAPAEVAESYRMQAAVYCLAGLKAGAPSVRMELLFLERPREPVVFEYRQEDRSLLEGLVGEALRAIKGSDFAPKPGMVCADCAVGDLCCSMARP
jgi:hypothetical protein